MAKGTHARRVVSKQLELVDPPHGAAARGKGRGKSTGAKKPSPRGSRKLPSDRMIAGALVKRLLRFVGRVIGAFLIVSVGLVVVYRFIDPPLTPLMVIRSLEGLGMGKLVWIDKQWISIDEVSPVLLRSVIASEDSRFFTHGGIDWDAVEEARKRNERAKGERLYGASTITMQCARNVFLWQGRNYIRKGFEVYFTYLMELVWGKERIMEIYINVIEWGNGIYGVEAAAQEYFNVSASKLNARQAALLAAVLPNPRRYDAGKPSGYVSGRARTIQARAGAVSLAPLGLARKRE